jgi:hypothetical protein
MAETTQAEPEVAVNSNTIHVWWWPDAPDPETTGGSWCVGGFAIGGPGSLKPGDLMYFTGCGATPAIALRRLLAFFEGSEERGASLAFDPDVPAPPQWRR